MLFHDMTDNTSKLTEAISTVWTFKNQVARWDKQVKSFIYQAFPKIRNRKRKFKEDEVGFLLEKRKKLKLVQATSKSEQDIEEVETRIVEKTEFKYAQLVKETIGGITGEDGNINTNGLWKKTRKIFPKNKGQILIALEDKKGNLITNYNSITNLALDEIVERLRQRPIHPNLRSLEKSKTKLAKLRLKIVKRRKSKLWEMKSMDKAIRSMKNNKCRDAYGLVNELLKPGVAGHDFKVSLLSLMNKKKDHLDIPIMMKYVNITLIPKPGKQNLRLISNHSTVQKPYNANASR